MSAAHVLQGGPIHGRVIMTAGKGADHYPAELRISHTEEDGTIIIHVYGINRGHAAAPTRAERPTYHYTHTVTI